MSIDTGQATNRSQTPTEGEQLFRTLIEKNTDAIALITIRGYISYANPAATRVTGYTSAELSGVSAFTLLHDEDSPTVHKHLRALRNKPEESITLRFRLKHKNGSLQWLECTIINLLHDPAVAALLCACHIPADRKPEEQSHEFEQVLETIPQMAWTATPDGAIDYYNAHWYNYTGQSFEEAQGWGWQPTQHPDDLQRTLIRWRHTLVTGEPFENEIRFKRAADGAYRWHIVRALPVRDTNGAILKWVGTCTDIDDQKRLEEAQKFLADASDLLNATLDYQTTLASLANLAVPRIADWCTVNVLENGVLRQLAVAHVHPEKAQWAPILQLHGPAMSTPGVASVVLRTGKSEIYPYITDKMLTAMARDEHEATLLRSLDMTSAMIVPLISNGKPMGALSFVATESGRRYGSSDLAMAEEIARRAEAAIENSRHFQYVLREIERRIRLEAELRASRDQLQAILQGVADGIIVQAPDGKRIFANKAAAFSTGFSSVESFLAAPPTAIQDKFEILNEAAQPVSIEQMPGQRALRGEQHAQEALDYHDKLSGKHTWMLIKATPIFDEYGNVILAIIIMHDITERVEAERRKDEFISMASHELKTPVTSLKGFTQILLRRGAASGDTQAQHYLSRIDAQLNRLTKLISDLLDISRVQTGKLIFREEPFDLDTMIAETVENMQGTTTTHSILLIGKAQAQLVGDRDRLEQVLINLLSNAIKYSPRADKVIVRVESQADEVVVSVQDFGIGIPEPHQQKIFERFYQVTEPVEKTYPGLGIGLYIASVIIQRHRGRIWVESNRGEGATFRFSLPTSLLTES